MAGRLGQCGRRTVALAAQLSAASVGMSRSCLPSEGWGEAAVHQLLFRSTGHGSDATDSAELVN